MPREQSPSLDNFEFLPEPSNFSPQKKTKISPVRILIVITALLVALLIFGNIFQGDIQTALAGNGSISGIVLDSSGQPPQNGYAKILGTTITATLAPDGSFKMEKVPVGPQSLVVLDQYTGREIPVVIGNGETLDIGTIQFKTTEVPVP